MDDEAVKAVTDRGRAELTLMKSKGIIGSTAYPVMEELIAAVERTYEQVVELRSEVREWLCEKCRVVYPGPPGPGLVGTLCLQCGGPCAPKTAMELRDEKVRVGRLVVEKAEIQSKLMTERATVERLCALCREVGKDVEAARIELVGIEEVSTMDEAGILEECAERLAKCGELADPEAAAHG